ncbi:MAG TPA: glutamine-hydrolyzing GMP synthase [Syntrophorhabdaceae bacterium]|nr:glutamine-hydrolyzing GMP synthase [Syntrophorhabdaceae bacterium]HQE79721.1 glutamine-hydrolyzing GMP synthase [Syntrophorhabdaceae bacterium]HQH43263.1 glutamine-hydrolyzing GMP synthase [Syntrophorhabdaceae bacterium]HQK46065.1 glutamine-hydrolyzing GMP synthase [Syntrophorhabdaceae bacterium]HRR71468.1 glutamine-hydrolyzing GMP synthase [Syntrophorhabdaceae bacterium]
MDYHRELIAILDFGSQYTQLIARKVRELGVYCEIYPYNQDINTIKKLKTKGIILSGGPSSVTEDNAPIMDRELLELDIPILGICYGLQLITMLCKGEISKSLKREYGKAHIFIDEKDPLLEGLSNGDIVWMSHQDRIFRLPEGFKSLAHSDNSPFAAIRSTERNIYGVQFHPEVHHTPKGKTLLNNFLYKICRCEGLFSPKSFVETAIADIKERTGDGNVICALSGGVDSSVVATLIHRAIGDRLHCVFVNNGVLRKNEVEEVIEAFQDKLHINLRYVNGEDRFLNALKKVKDPEKKRKIIGRLFIEIFEEEAHKVGDVQFLAQGTLYPDVIESVSSKGPSATIKSHHNVGGLPKRMRLKLIEPLRELFKDEVRQVGRELGIPENIINRQPFPGPGLAIRIIGEVTKDRLDILREADSIVREEIEKNKKFKNIWQSFAILIPVKTVGVMGDERTYANVIAIRVVESEDAMTADWTRLPYEILDKLSRRIINEVHGVNRVVYDISSKPPSTIEWE